MHRVAVTMGDPAGIGPEIMLKAVERLRPALDAGELALVLIGCFATYEATARALGLETGVRRVSADQLDQSSVVFLDVGTGHPLAPGSITAEAGHAAFEAVNLAVKLATTGKVDAICTAPLSKLALNLAGHPYAGHTEMLSALTGSRDSVMMLVHDGIRVSHVSTHSALGQVPSRLTPQRLERVVRLTHEALIDLGVARPRIAVAALNPHAGEGGLFGTEDIEITEPTVAALRAEGFDVTGPHPGDTVFVKHRAGQFDAVVAMYHDQGHIPVKLLAFQVDERTGRWQSLSGVNITLGLPIIRTSVDHGTAFDIAGKGVANEDSLIEAIHFARTLISARKSRPAPTTYEPAV